MHTQASVKAPMKYRITLSPFSLPASCLCAERVATEAVALRSKTRATIQLLSPEAILV
jgi:hypothetical protein